ncbi:MAG TPA: hypothetical protein VFU72_10660 [Nitrolancea sp.]|nr:hypothetical protein [Nitrolancea sp.]
MFDQIDLNLRYRAYAEQIERANCLPVHLPLEPVVLGSPRLAAANLLRRISARLDPEQARRAERQGRATV